jgi:6-phosphogluconolactonase
MEPMVKVLEDEAAVQRASAAAIADAAREAIAARGRFRIALTGGRTPLGTYQALAREELAWEKVVAFFGDERCVSPDHPESNYGMARDALLALVPAKALRMKGELAPEEAAAEYEAELAKEFGPGVPRFDLVLLGLGEDGHVASLFPGTKALDEARRLVTTSVAPTGSERVTLTLPVLNAAAQVMFIVAGERKRWAVAQALCGGPVPASRVRAARTTWFLDRDADHWYEDVHAA